MKKILIIEDENSLLEVWTIYLNKHTKKGELKILSAVSIDEARKVFNSNPDIDLIILDGYIKGPGERPNSLVLIPEFRKTYHGIIIASSSNEDHRSMMVAAGCDYDCKKDDVYKKIMEALESKE